MIAFVVLLVVFGVTPIIVGTILIRKTQHKKLGTALRIFGYIIVVPIVVGPIMCLLAVILSGNFA